MKNVTIITGPTASGKTSYSLNYAKSFKKSIIINADASAVYKNFPILTAQNDVKNSAIKHLLFEVTEITNHFDVGMWLTEVEKILKNPEYADFHKIIVGGTCLYIFLLINGIFEMPTINAETRNFVTEKFNLLGYEKFLEEVLKYDEFTNKDKQRLINNYCFILQTGKTFKELSNAHRKNFLSAEEFELIKINPERETLYQNCNQRFENMLKEGAIKEVEVALLKYGKHFKCNKIIGFNEIASYINNELTLTKAKELAQQKTRNLAKRQITWMINKL